MSTLKEIVTSCRTIRSYLNILPSQQIDALISVNNATAKKLFEDVKEIEDFKNFKRRDIDIEILKAFLIEQGFNSLIGRLPNEEGFIESRSAYVALQKNNKEINVVNDQWNNPTWTESISFIINKIIDNSIIGLYNYGDKDFMSRYDFAILISKIVNLDENLINTVKNGLQGSAMPAWGEFLAEDEILAVVQFVKSLVQDREWDDEDEEVNNVITEISADNGKGPLGDAPWAATSGPYHLGVPQEHIDAGKELFIKNK